MLHFRRTQKQYLERRSPIRPFVVLDLEKFANAAHAHGVPFIVDNTFATPINCRPV